MHKTIRILNIEASENDASLLRQHLTQAGYELVFKRVETAREAKAAFEAGTWDVIFADYVLPDFSAMEAFDLIRQTGLDIPLIIVSGNIGEEIAVEAMRYGISDCLIKGKLARLAEAVERVMAETKAREVRRTAEAETSRLGVENQQQRDRLNMIIARVPGIVWEVWDHPDESRRQTNFVSEYVQKMLGYSVQEWLATPNFWLSIIHPDDREKIAMEAASGLLEKEGRTQTFRWIARDRRVLWVESNFTVIVNDNGDPIGTRGVTLDVSERKISEDALRETEQRFRGYFELGLVGMAITSVNRGLLEVNDEACKILGYSRSELLNRNWLDLTYPEDIATDTSLFNNIIAGDCDGYSANKRFVHKKGHTIYANISMKCVRRTDGVIAFFVSLFQDITRSRRAEDGLRASEERYRQLFECNPNPTFVLDQETQKFLAVNQAVVDEYGYTREELLLLTGRDIRPADEVPTFVDRLSAMPNGPPRGSTWKHQRKNGKTIDVEITRRPLMLDGRPAWMIIAQNVTGQRTLEEQFRQAQKMEAVGQLAGGMAHDFNNLLTVIIGYSELALAKLMAEDPLRNDMEQIMRAGERAATLTRQLLAFSRKQVLMPTIVNPNQVISNVEGMLRRLIGEDITLCTSLTTEVGCFKADRSQIEQVVMNLVVNARDAMPSGGLMTIETQNVELTSDYAKEMVSVNPGPHVMLAVTDTGTGMDAATRAQIFEPFFTTKEVGKGTGLGLSTVYGIVHQSGGSIWVHSEVGRGTTFKLYFPRVDPVEESTEKGMDTIVHLHHTETILLTEDDEMVRALAFTVLTAHGYKVLSANNGEAALLICEQNTESIHLLITDVVMPQMSGAELAERLNQVRPDMKVLFMSGYADKAIVHQQILDEKTWFIQKPFAPQALVRKVQEVLNAIESPPVSIAV